MPADILKLIGLRAAGSAFFLYPVYTLFLLSRDLDLTGVMTLESILALALILCEVPSDVLADRLGKKKLILLGCLFELCSTVPMLWVRGFWAYSLLYALSGIGIACTSGSLEAYLYDRLREKSAMPRYLGYLRAAEWGGMALGALGGGFVVAWASAHAYALCIQLFILSQALALLLALLLTTDAPASRSHRETFRSILLFGGRTVFRSSAVLALILLSLAFRGLSDRHYLWQPYFQGQNLEMRWFGIVAVLVCGGCVAGGLVAGWLSRRLRPRPIVLSSGLLLLGGLLTVALVRDYRLTLPAMLLLFFLGTLLEPIFTSMLNDRFPDEARATALSCTSWVSSLIVMAVRPGMGFLADLDITYPFRVDIAVLAAGLLAAAAAAPLFRPPQS